MALGTDTYQEFDNDLRFPKRRTTSAKQYHEARILPLELKLKEASVRVAEAELVFAEARGKTETARLGVIEHKMKMALMGFAI
ncbi:hypothetical protein FRC01_014544 [Tulasnella sp. 417]|nr:hypothetical protein FRC01_014544 [Tulasnella sp. 417]